MQTLRTLITISLISLCVSSCVSKKKVLYFQDIDSIKINSKKANYNTIIRSNDILSISVSGATPEVVAPFNGSTIIPAGSNGEGWSQNAYVVDENGSIDFPLIGSVILGNLSRVEAIEKLKSKVSLYVKNPVINLRISNFSITILGEVRRPGTYTIDDEKVSLLEALGLAGDLTIYGDRKNVRLIREYDGMKTYKKIDLTTAAILDSDQYYLQQNDVLIISPNKAQVQSSGFSNSTGILFSATSLVLTIIALFSR